MQYFEVKGTNYEMGFKIGKQFKPYLNKIIVKYDKAVEKTYEKISFLENKMRKLLPNCLEEIYGRADGAGVSRKSMLLMFCPEIFKQVDNCTTVIAKTNNRVLFTHNEDEKGCSFENIALIKYIYKDFFVVSLTRADRLAGSAFSFNSYGILISSNYVYGDEFNLNNLSRYIVSRDIINSKNINEAMGKLKNIDVASAFSLNMLDMNSKEVINVEKDIHDMYVTNIESKYARSNHFHAKEHNEDKDPISSKFRYKKANELLNKINIESCEISELFEILNYKTDDYYQSIHKDYTKYNDKSTTIATFLHDTDSDEIVIYDYIEKSKIVLYKNGEVNLSL